MKPIRFYEEVNYFPPKEKVLDKLPPKLKKFYAEFFICTNCSKICQHDNHVKGMSKVVNKFMRT
ncbi:MAG: hypothetical protein M5R37_08285 [Melioribacteraceae bacterium]|nr:hypothetical protein [Melioribacteraceae bacterium]